MARLPNQAQLIEAFLTGQTHKHTIDTYRISVRQLVDWAQAQGIDHVANMTTPHLDLYAVHLRDRNLKPRTLAGKQGCIKRFFEYLVDRKVIKSSPVPEGWVPPQPKRAAEEPLLALEEIRSMLEHAKDDDARALVTLGGLDGLKAQFIYAATAEDVTFSQGRAVVAIRRRDGISHAIPLSPESTEVLRRLCEARPVGHLILPTRGSDPRRKAGRKIAGAAKRAGIKTRVTPRILEKSHRAEMFAEGTTLNAVRSRLGLSTTSSTAYAASLLPKYGTGNEGAALVSQAAHEADALELLRQAEQLCDQPGITPIAPIVIAGAALEMVLRRMCDQRQLTIQGKESIDAYSTSLYRVGLISKHSHFTNQTNGKLRNEAAHGSESADVSIENARLMISSVVLFVTASEEEDDEVDEDEPDEGDEAPDG